MMFSMIKKVFVFLTALIFYLSGLTLGPVIGNVGISAASERVPPETLGAPGGTATVSEATQPRYLGTSPDGEKGAGGNPEPTPDTSEDNPSDDSRPNPGDSDEKPSPPPPEDPGNHPKPDDPGNNPTPGNPPAPSNPSPPTPPQPGTPLTFKTPRPSKALELAIIQKIIRNNWFIFPIDALDGKVVFSDNFGQPREGYLHQGVDIEAKQGSPLIAVEDGLAVPKIGARAGNYVVLKSKTGMVYKYMHLSKFGTKGPVRGGDVIGYVGNSGNAIGGPPHLHFEMWRGLLLNPYLLLKTFWQRKPVMVRAKPTEPNRVSEEAIKPENTSEIIEPEVISHT